MSSCQIRDDIHEKLLQLGVASPGIACAREYIEFNPLHEKPSLLRAWLIYRGFQDSDMHGDLTDIAIDEIQRPGKPFAGFTSFDPSTASNEFLSIWLSWFGISSKATNSRNEMIKMTTKILKLLRQLAKQEAPLKKFDRLLSLQRRLRQKERGLQRLHLLLQGLEPELKVVKEPSDFGKKDEESRKINENNTLMWALKILFAKSLQATAIVAPIVLVKIQRGLEPTRVPEVEEPREGEPFLHRLQYEMQKEIPALVTETAAFAVYEPELAAAVLRDINKTQGQKLAVPREVLGFFSQQILLANPGLPKFFKRTFQTVFVIIHRVSSAAFVNWLQKAISGRAVNIFVNRLKEVMERSVGVEAA